MFVVLCLNVCDKIRWWEEIAIFRSDGRILLEVGDKDDGMEDGTELPTELEADVFIENDVGFNGMCTLETSDTDVAVVDWDNIDSVADLLTEPEMFEDIAGENPTGTSCV